MPSPFPGMDPYLESPAIWPDFHDALAGEIRNVLNQTLPDPYYARLEMRSEVGIAAVEGVAARIVSDVSVVRRPARDADGSSTAEIDRPRTELSRSYHVRVLDEVVRHHFVEIRDPTHGHELITLIEIVSPSNKQPKFDRQSYERKQQEVLQTDANLVELDLLRDGERIAANPHLRRFIDDLRPRPDYVVLVSRAWERGSDGTGHQVFSFSIRAVLPCIPVPLRQGEAEVPLDLQFLFNRTYDAGPYRRGAIEYGRSPEPGLASEDAEWAEARVREHLRK